MAPYTPDRRGEHPQRHLANFTGLLQADAFAGYADLYVGDQIHEAACMAHARRKLHDLHAVRASPITSEALERIGALYRIEEHIRGKPPEERRRVRQEKAVPLLDDMKRSDILADYSCCCGKHGCTGSMLASVSGQQDSLPK